MDIVFLDIETTGIDPRQGEIIAIGAVKTEDGVAKETFSSLVRPSAPLSEPVGAITGFTDEHFVSAPDIKTVLERFFAFLDGCRAASYGVAFDRNFLKAAAQACDLPFPRTEWIDLLALAKTKLPGLKSYKLSAVMSRLGCRALRDDRLSSALSQKELWLRLNELPDGGEGTQETK